MKKTKSNDTNRNDTKPKIRLQRRTVIITVLVVIAILAAASIGLAGFTVAYKNKIYPRTYIGTQDFGGKTRDEARAILQSKVATLPAELPIAIDGTVKTKISVKDAGLEYNIPETLTHLFAIGRTGGIAQNIEELLASLFSKNETLARYSFDEAKATPLITTIAEKESNPAVNAKITLEGTNPVISPAKQGHGINAERLIATLKKDLGQFIFTSSVTTQLLEPTITEAQADYALNQTKTILAKAPFTITAAPATLTADSITLFSWLTYTTKEAADVPALPTPTPVITPVAGISKARAHDNAPHILVAEFDQKRVKDFIETFSTGVNQEPENATLAGEGGQVKIVKMHRDGKKVRVDDATSLVIKTLQDPITAANATLELPVDVVEAEIKDSSIEKLGIKELIGQGQTNFKGSPENRVHNITTGARFLNGVIVPKGEEFSTLKMLGTIDGAAGYLPELVIKNNRTVPDFGGGLCQVSTTLFRAALNSGLPITARTNHSYRVSYYEPPVGLDATIFQGPDVDFKFKNDTPGSILVMSKVEGTKITFEIYGTKDGREAVVSDTVMTNVTEPPAEIRTDTDTLPKGEVKQIEKPHPGANTSVTYTVTRDGKEINKQTFRSHYVAWAARFLVGTKE